MSENRYKVLECNSSDNEYLHKDFHGALCYAIKYLDETCGHDVTMRYLKQVGVANFLPLVNELKIDGVVALERHFRRVFELEGGQIEYKRESEYLEIAVLRCPAISHLKSTGQFFTNRYCETTVNVNLAICDAAGYQCSCDYVPGEGRCIQKFWKKGLVK